MGNVILNISFAIAASLVAGLLIYYCPPVVASFLDRAVYKVMTPFRWIVKPLLRFMGITDRD
jgi:hypothetical protein